MTYATDHVGAVADIREAGTAVTFTLLSDTLDPSTSTSTALTTTTVAGYAIKVRGNPLRYAELGLKLTEAPTLLFAPTTYGETPPMGASVVWNGVTYLVKDVNDVAPDGTAIVSRVTVSR